MEIFLNILLMLHFLGLAMGMGTGLALSRVSPKLAEAEGTTRSTLFSIATALGKNGHIGLGLLLVTGILMVVLKYQGISSFGTWFWIKMVFVVILSASVGMGSAAYRKAAAGEDGALQRTKMFGAINGVSSLAIIVSAVMAFN